MYAYRIASRPGNVLAPRDFVHRLRRDTGCRDLHCWWDPTCNRDVQQGDGTTELRYGCWVVWQQIRVLRYMQFGKVTIGVPVNKWVDVFKIDGSYGCPTVLGEWVIKAMNHSDMSKPCNKDRDRMLNDMNERHILEPLHQARVFSEDFTRDRMVRRLFQKRADEVGVPMKTRDDVNAEYRKLLSQNSDSWARAEALAKSYRIHGRAW